MGIMSNGAANIKRLGASYVRNAHIYRNTGQINSVHAAPRSAQRWNARTQPQKIAMLNLELSVVTTNVRHETVGMKKAMNIADTAKNRFPGKALRRQAHINELAQTKSISEKK